MAAELQTIFELYNEYQDKRAGFYSWAESIAQFCDRSTRLPRCIVILNEDQYTSYHNQLSVLYKMRDELQSCSDLKTLVGFDFRARTMKLPPLEPLTGVSNILRFESPAMSSKTISKDQVARKYATQIKKLSALIKAAKATGKIARELLVDYADFELRLERLKNEHQLRLDDPTLTYRIRYQTGIDIRASLHWPKSKKIDAVHEQLTSVGLFVYDPAGICKIIKEPSPYRHSRSDSLENHLTPLPCSGVEFNGQLYRESDVERLRLEGKIN